MRQLLCCSKHSVHAAKSLQPADWQLQVLVGEMPHLHSVKLLVGALPPQHVLKLMPAAGASGNRGQQKQAAAAGLRRAWLWAVWAASASCEARMAGR